MKIPDWLLGHYKKKFGDDIIVLDHAYGPTWNGVGDWNTTILKRGNEIFRVHMPSDYQTDRLEVTKMKTILKEEYIPL